MAAFLCFLVAIVRAQGAVAITGVTLGGAALTWATLRRRASTTDGAVWTASGALVRGMRQFPGQVSLTGRSVVWLPSRSSLRKGAEAVSIAVDEPGAWVTSRSGAGLLDVRIHVHGADGTAATILTHRKPGLSEVVAHLEGTAGQPARD